MHVSHWQKKKEVIAVKQKYEKTGLNRLISSNATSINARCAKSALEYALRADSLMHAPLVGGDVFEFLMYAHAVHIIMDLQLIILQISKNMVLVQLKPAFHQVCNLRIAISSWRSTDINMVRLGIGITSAMVDDRKNQF